MFIVMHCGGMPFNGDTVNHKSLGGSESAAYYLAREFARVGHNVTLFTNYCPEEGEEKMFDGVKYEWMGEVTENNPFGENFHYYAIHTPIEVLIMQRAPGAFNFPWNTKINVWWTHDLALHRQAHNVGGQMLNVDMVWTVSEYHKQQLHDVYGINEDIIKPITNGVDLELFDQDKTVALVDGFEPSGSEFSMLYTSRPERGLEHHVKPGGIMERLWKVDKAFHLYVCMYENFPQHMVGYYQWLFRRCNELPNVTVLGSLSKQRLADVMRQCDALVYPTEFEEVSCITAMEAMAAGLPFISSDVGALSETCDGAGCVLIPLKDDGADEQGFIDEVIGMAHQKVSNKTDTIDEVRQAQLDAAQNYSWEKACERALATIEGQFSELRTDHGANMTELMDKSDIYALRYYVDKHGEESLHSNEIAKAKLRELDECYQFMKSPDAWNQHYQDYYRYEQEVKGVEYGYNAGSSEHGREDPSGNPRFEHVAGTVHNQLGGPGGTGTVVDYGCAHGHYLINLAKRFPNATFIGIDITESNVEIARKWAEEEGLSKRARFYVGEVRDGKLQVSCSSDARPKNVDVVIAAEVLEHLEDYQGTIDALCGMLHQEGRFIATTPYGPWEAEGYKQEWPWRAHVHHFERADIKEIAGHHPDFHIYVIKFDARKGSYCWDFKKPTKPSGYIDYERKLSYLVPTRQTVSLCMIVRDAEYTIKRCLSSAMPHVDELVVAIDKTTEDRTAEEIVEYMQEHWPEKPCTLSHIASPLETGFDAARNKSIECASGQWILWLDADEELHVQGDYKRVFRHNQFNAYSLPQQHLSMEPAGLLKTDYPARLFRNGLGIQFYGKVHEHPEIAFNEGIGDACMIGAVQIAHFAYKDEQTRVSRFNRNIDLLVWDREEYPERKLGKFLWLRDLAQMCQQELAGNGGRATPEMVERAQMGVETFEEILNDDEPNMRFIQESLQYYSTCARILGRGFEYGVQMDASKLNGGAHPERAAKFAGYFHCKEHVEKLTQLLIDERTANYESKYY